MAGSHGLAFTLERDGAEGLDLAVVSFTLEEELSQPFELSVSFASRDGGMTAKDWLDVNATLTVWQDGEPVRRVTGAVARFARGDTGHRRTHYEIVIRPALWRLTAAPQLTDLRERPAAGRDPDPVRGARHHRRGLRHPARAAGSGIPHAVP